MTQNTTPGMHTEIKITIVYDNNSTDNNLTADWGFACVVETGQMKILFDTGDNGKILLENMQKLNIDPLEIDIVFLSHYHHDHTGGLKDFLSTNSNVKVYYPQSFPENLKETITTSGAQAFPVSAHHELFPGIWTLGEYSGIIPEQSLAVHSSKGIVIIAGCAHPGISDILRKAKALFPGDLIHLVLGGFHLHKMPETEIENTILVFNELTVGRVAPAHCCGNTARKLFKNGWGKDYIEAGTGEIVEID
jgi:7,8-dihydropterin-6-yl-methyl-4-(beta-D-ribofuranosyl)aminobenzene 5'-phosphate synthase